MCCVVARRGGGDFEDAILWIVSFSCQVTKQLSLVRIILSKHGTGSGDINHLLLQPILAHKELKLLMSFPLLFRHLRLRLASPNSLSPQSFLSSSSSSSSYTQHVRQRIQKRFASSPADQEGFISVLDRPPTLVRHNRKHRPLGLAFLGSSRNVLTPSTGSH